MEDIINVIMNNGLGAAAFVFLIFYIYTDKKQTNEEKSKTNELFLQMVKTLDSNTNTMKLMSDSQREMTETLEKMNYRMELIEEKIKSKEE